MAGWGRVGEGKQQDWAGTMTEGRQQDAAGTVREGRQQDGARRRGRGHVGCRCSVACHGPACHGASHWVRPAGRAPGAGAAPGGASWAPSAALPSPLLSRTWPRARLWSRRVRQVMFSAGSAGREAEEGRWAGLGQGTVTCEGSCCWPFPIHEPCLAPTLLPPAPNCRHLHPAAAHPPAGMEGACSLRMRELVLAGLATTSTCRGAARRRARLGRERAAGFVAQRVCARRCSCCSPEPDPAHAAGIKREGAGRSQVARAFVALQRCAAQPVCPPFPCRPHTLHPGAAFFSRALACAL